MTEETKLEGAKAIEKLQLNEEEITRFITTSVGRLAVIVRSRAPKKTGNLRLGIVASPWTEQSAKPGKVVKEVFFAYTMNDVFVKFSRNGTRYYYPASQEYGFFVENLVGHHRHIDGKYFMRDSSIQFAPAFEADGRKLLEGIIREP